MIFLPILMKILACCADANTRTNAYAKVPQRISQRSKRIAISSSGS